MNERELNIGKRLIENNEPIDPFVHLEPGESINPIVFLDVETNGDDRFAILKTTENGKYVRSGMLWFTMNGVEIYTDIDNIIFVDKVNKTFFVREGKKIVDQIAPTKPEERQYVLLMKCIDSGDYYYRWESLTGRIDTYDYIVDNIDILGMYPDESYVLTDNVALKDAITVAEFVRYLKNSELVPDDGFDIDEYIIEE